MSIEISYVLYSKISFMSMKISKITYKIFYYHFMIIPICILPATYNYLSEAILLRCTKYSLEIELQELSSPVLHGHSEQFSLKSIKGI